MDKRVRERRRSVNRERGRRRAVMLVALAAVLIAVGLFLCLRSSDVFAVKRVTATAVEHVTEDEIGQATADARGVSLLRLSTAAIEADLSALPYVRDVEVHRRFPDTLEIRLVEYEPIACLRAADGKTWLVGDDGRALEPTNSATLPLLVPTTAVKPVAGETVPESIVAALPAAGLLVSEEIADALPDVDHISVSSGGEVSVLLVGGAELRLGNASELKRKLTVAAEIVERYLRDGKQIEYVDASVPSRVAVNAR